MINTTVKSTDPATGTLILRIDPVDATASPVEYAVERSSDFDTFFWIFVAALVVGAVSAFFTGRTLRAASADNKVLPPDYAYDKPWASATAFLGAISTTALAQSGALSTISPQYQTTGITIANIAVTLILAASPLLVGAAYGTLRPSGKRSVLIIVTLFVMTGFAAQTFLNGLFFLTTGIIRGVPAFTVLLFVLVLVLLLPGRFVWKTLALDLPSTRPSVRYTGTSTEKSGTS
ncbi:hypothetical protein [Actinomycetospora aeridis]|uniref:Uncharacterized protein n=1 Tax=Actinomycetospora aeridis TaxID=3129231 RepID=A0ABU8N871_9PSEU